MKKIKLAQVLAAALCLLMLWGCAGPSPDGQTPEPDPLRPEETGMDGEGSGPDAAAPEPPESEGDIGFLTGSVLAWDESTLTLIAEDGRYTFALDSDTLTLNCPEIKRGYIARVTFRGPLEGPGDYTGLPLISLSVSDYRGLAPGEAADYLLPVLSLEEKVGQLFLARCPETEGAALAARYALGGYVLFGRDFEGKSAPEVSEAVAAYQAASAIPMLIAVDEEGGTVCRVSANPRLRASRFLSPQALYARGGWESIAADTAEKCDLLKSLGINVNLAPVCDVCTDPKAFMYRRSFGQDGAGTGEYVSRVVGVMSEHGVGSVLKHFPGYGNNADTHVGGSLDTRSLESFRQSDFLPFMAGISAGADAVMVSHVIVQAMDGDNPASLSPAVHRLLREELGFEGVIMTDDLSMDAVAAGADPGELAVLAVLAGNDMLCSTDFEVQVSAVLEAAGSGRIPADRIDDAAARVLAWKHALGLIA